MIQRVDFPLQKHRQLECKLCGQTAGSGNPLRLADRAENDKYGNHRPWAKYLPSTIDGEAVRVPAGKLCLLCLNCYRQLGYRHKYGSLGNYMQHVASHPGEHAEQFQRSLQLYIKKLQEEGPEKNRLKQKQDLLAAQITLDDELRRGTKRSKRWTFIEREYWDDTKRGPLPKDKLVQQMVDGEKKWGIICEDEPRGHHRFESFEARQIVESDRIFDSSQGIFAEEALQRARETYSQGQQREQRLREQQAVSDVPKAALPTAEQVDQLTEMIRSLGSRSIGNVGAIDLKDDATTEEWAAPAHGGKELGAEDTEGSLAPSQGGGQR